MVEQLRPYWKLCVLLLKVASFRRKSAPSPKHLAALKLRSLGGSSTSDYSCAASQNTKINKQSQRFWGPFVRLNKCLNPLLWLHFALTSSSCASFVDQLKNGVPLLSRHMPSIRCCSTHTNPDTHIPCPSTRCTATLILERRHFSKALI